MRIEKENNGSEEQERRGRGAAGASSWNAEGVLIIRK